MSDTLLIQTSVMVILCIAWLCFFLPKCSRNKRVFFLWSVFLVTSIGILFTLPLPVKRFIEAFERINSEPAFINSAEGQQLQKALSVENLDLALFKVWFHDGGYLTLLIIVLCVISFVMLNVELFRNSSASSPEKKLFRAIQQRWRR